MKVYGIWYFGSIVRGPFANKRLAQKAIAEIRSSCTCAYERLEIADYDHSFDMQGNGFTHPSVLALLGSGASKVESAIRAIRIPDEAEVNDKQSE